LRTLAGLTEHQVITLCGGSPFWSQAASLEQWRM